jgi:hypothetical protein
MPIDQTRRLLRRFISTDPAAPNGDLEVTVTGTMGSNGTVSIETIRHALDEPTSITSTSGTNEALTLEAIERARDLFVRNDVPDVYGVSPAASIIRSYHDLERMRRDQRLAEIEAAAATVRREGTRPMVEIEFQARNDHFGQTQVSTRLREMHHNALVATEYLRPENFEEIARNTSRQMEESIYRETLLALQRAEADRLFERYGRSAARDMAEHWSDMLRYGADTVIGKTVAEGPIAWMADLKYKTIEHNGWKATALDTTDLIKAEGKAMEHCFAGYVRRCVDEKYIAFHIDPPKDSGKKWPKSGFTVGFKVTKNGDKREYRYDQIKGKKNNTHYVREPDVVEMLNVIENAIGATTDIKVDAAPSWPRANPGEMYVRLVYS